MRRKFEKILNAQNYKMTPVDGELPIVMVVLGVAITPAWAVMLFWFLYHYITWQTSH